MRTYEDSSCSGLYDSMMTGPISLHSHLGPCPELSSNYPAVFSLFSCLAIALCLCCTLTFTGASQIDNREGGIYCRLPPSV